MIMIKGKLVGQTIVPDTMAGMEAISGSQPLPFLLSICAHFISILCLSHPLLAPLLTEVGGFPAGVTLSLIIEGLYPWSSYSFQAMIIVCVYLLSELGNIKGHSVDYLFS